MKAPDSFGYEKKTERSIKKNVGGLFENFCILERLKANTYNQNHPNYYFWRTYDQQEIDFYTQRDKNLDPKNPDIILGNAYVREKSILDTSRRT